MPRGVSKDPKHFKEILDKGVILVAGDGDVIDLDDPEPVRVAIMFDVNGYGPHVGTIYAMQRGHVDEALQAADELLEEWTLEKYPDSIDNEHFTETFDGFSWTLPVDAFADAIEGTDATKFIETTEEEEEEAEAGEVREGVSEPNDARDILEGLGKYMTHEGHDAPRESARIARMIAGVRGNSDKADKVLEEVDRLVAGNGVEPIRDENANDRYYGDVVALYVNMGDTYETTLLYDTVEHEFHVTSWGDWYEAYEAEQEEEEPEDEEDPEEEDE